MKNIAYIFTLIMLTLFNCSEAGSDIIYMNRLKNDISETYDINKIDIKLFNGDSIKIILIDSKFKNESWERKQKITNKIEERAIQIKERALQHKEKIPKLRTGEFIFTDETNFSIVKTTTSESFNLFEYTHN